MPSGEVLHYRIFSNTLTIDASTPPQTGLYDLTFNITGIHAADRPGSASATYTFGVTVPEPGSAAPGLLVIVSPGAEIRQGYHTTVIETKDGATLAGFISEQAGEVISLRDPAARRIPFPKTAS